MKLIFADRECHELGNPEKGRVLLTGRSFADRTMYSCEDGYRLVGVEFRLCQSDGSWSATEPSCQKIGESLLFYFLLFPHFLPTNFWFISSRIVLTIHDTFNCSFHSDNFVD